MLTKVFALVLVVLIGLALGVATLQQKDAQIAELQKRVVQLEGADRDLVRYHMNQAETYRNLAASRVSATPKARDDLRTGQPSYGYA